MGCTNSKLDDLPAVALCRERCDFLDEAIHQRYVLAETHIAYVHSLKQVGHSLHSFITNQDYTAGHGGGGDSPLNLPPAKKGGGGASRGIKIQETPSSSSAVKGHHLHSNSSGHIEFHLDPDEDDSGSGSLSGHSSPLHDHFHPNHHLHEESPSYGDIGYGNFGNFGNFPQMMNMDQETLGGYNMNTHTHMNYMKSQAKPSIVYEQKPVQNYHVGESSTSSSSYNPYSYPNGYLGPGPGPGYGGGGGGYYGYPPTYGSQTSPQPAGAGASSSKPPPPPPSPPRASAWDFLNPFESYEKYYQQYNTPSRDSKELREEEGIPDLEDEEFQHEVVKKVHGEEKFMNDGGGGGGGGGVADDESGHIDGSSSDDADPSLYQTRPSVDGEGVESVLHNITKRPRGIGFLKFKIVDAVTAAVSASNATQGLGIFLKAFRPSAPTRFHIIKPFLIFVTSSVIESVAPLITPSAMSVRPLQFTDIVELSNKLIQDNGRLDCEFLGDKGKYVAYHSLIRSYDEKNFIIEGRVVALTVLILDPGGDNGMTSNENVMFVDSMVEGLRENLSCGISMVLIFDPSRGDFSGRETNIVRNLFAEPVKCLLDLLKVVLERIGGLKSWYQLSLGNRKLIVTILDPDTLGMQMMKWKSWYKFAGGNWEFVVMIFDPSDTFAEDDSIVIQGVETSLDGGVYWEDELQRAYSENVYGNKIIVLAEDVNSKDAMNGIFPCDGVLFVVYIFDPGGGWNGVFRCYWQRASDSKATLEGPLVLSFAPGEGVFFFSDVVVWVYGGTDVKFIFNIGGSVEDFVIDQHVEIEGSKLLEDWPWSISVEVVVKFSLEKVYVVREGIMLFWVMIFDPGGVVARIWGISHLEDKVILDGGENVMTRGLKKTHYKRKERGPTIMAQQAEGKKPGPMSRGESGDHGKRETSSNKKGVEGQHKREENKSIAGKTREGKGWWRKRIGESGEGNLHGSCSLFFIFWVLKLVWEPGSSCICLLLSYLHS